MKIATFSGHNKNTSPTGVENWIWTSFGALSDQFSPQLKLKTPDSTAAKYKTYLLSLTILSSVCFNNELTYLYHHNTNRKMVWTNQQTNAFFQDIAQMGIPAPTQDRLATNENIVTVESLIDINKDAFSDIASNLRKPGGTMPDPNDPNLRVPQHPFVMSAMSLQKLQVASVAASYYKTIGRELTHVNMHYTNVLKDFYMQWKALEEKKKEDEPKVPIVTKGLPITKWTDTFNDFCCKVIGARNIPLAYVIRDRIEVLPIPEPLAPGKSYSASSGSVEAELVERASHDHALYRSDNAKVYSFIEEAVRSSQYNASIKPFQRAKDGRGAYRALVSQHAGKDKWEAELRMQEDRVINRIWKGNASAFTLEAYIQMHRQAFISMAQCADHVSFQVPNDRTRVKHMVDNIQCADPELLSLLALVKNDDTLMSDFEAAATMILPACPVARRVKQTGKGNDSANIGSLETVLKEGRGASGVEFRWHPKAEYVKLSDEQKVELREWRMKSEKGKGGAKKNNPKGKDNPKKKSHTKAKFKAQISSLEKKFEDKIEELTKKLSSGGAAAIGATVGTGMTEQPKAVSAVEGQSTKLSLSSILKRNDVQIGSVTFDK